MPSIGTVPQGTSQVPARSFSWRGVLNSNLTPGFIQNEIARSAYEYQKNIENNSKVIVGVNKFVTNDDAKIPGFKIDDSIQKMQCDKLKLLKSKRNNEDVKQSLQKISAAAITNENLMPVVLEAVENLCTLGEISDALRTVYGEYR